MASLQPIRARHPRQQRVAIILADIAEAEATFIVEAIIIREICDQPPRQDGKITRCHAVFRIGPAGAVAEIAVGQTNAPASFVQQLGKLLFTAGNRLGQHNAGIIA